jgi:hypothetical protein
LLEAEEQHVGVVLAEVAVEECDETALEAVEVKANGLHFGAAFCQVVFGAKRNLPANQASTPEL